MCSSVKSRHSSATYVGCTVLVLVLTARMHCGVLRISDKAQHCLCNVECTGINGRLWSCLWFIFWVFAVYRLLNRCTIINNTLYSTYSLRQNFHGQRSLNFPKTGIKVQNSRLWSTIYRFAYNFINSWSKIISSHDPNFLFLPAKC